MRFALFILFSFLLTIQLKSQAIKFGINAGMGLMSIQVNGLEESPNYAFRYDHMTSFTAGMHFGIQFTKNFGISVEPGMIRKGGLIAFESNFYDYVSYEFYRQLYYFNLPIMIEYYPIPRIYIYGGTESGFLVKNNEIPKSNSQLVIPVVSDIQKNDTSIIFGMGFRVNKAFEIAFRYSHSITPLNGFLSDNEIISGFYGENTRHFHQYLCAMFKINMNALNDPSCDTGWRPN